MQTARSYLINKLELIRLCKQQNNALKRTTHPNNIKNSIHNSNTSKKTMPRITVHVCEGRWYIYIPLIQ